MNKKIKIAILLYSNSITGGGGTERRFLRIWSNLVKKNYNINIIMTRKQFDSARDSKLIDIEYLNKIFIFESKNLFFDAFAIYKIVKKINCDLLHLVLQRRLFFFYLLLYLFKFKKIVICSVTDSLISTRFHNSFVVRMSVWLIFRISFKIETLYHSFIENWALDDRNKRRIVLAPCSFTDLDSFKKTKKHNSLIVFSGRLVSYKNPELFLDALLKIPKNRRWEAIIAGAGPLKNKLIKIVNEKFHHNSVIFTEHIDMSNILSKSTIFVSLQQIENYPSQSLIEAMATQNAVIASNVGETKRLIKNNINGFLVALDSDDLAQKITMLLDNPSLRESIGNNAFNTIFNDHTIDKYLEHLLAIWYSSLKPENE